MFLYIVLNSLAVFIVSQILPGVRVENFVTAIFVAIALGIINTFIKPIILFFTLPLNILTLGLFTFVINALLVVLVSNFIQGFFVEDFLNALLFSLLVSVTVSVLNTLSKK
ncbi:phage holin family protein [Candidatus Parcubacteria bacterium]|nr:MAG: phage holin family protein [Candidatus Parcubacteria bacterium]